MALSRFRREIRADLMEVYGVDVTEWYRARRWRALIDLVDMLPTASRYHEAISQDEDVAEEYLRYQAESGDESTDIARPPYREFDTHAKILTDIGNELKQLRQTVVAAHGGKPRKEPPLYGPDVAVDRVRERMDTEGAMDIFRVAGASDEMLGL